MADREYNDIVNELIPHIAHVVDQQGGLMAISKIGEDQKVIDFITKMPEGFEKRLNKIVAKYGDYFAILDGGFVATYKAYETGRVDQNNNIVKKAAVEKIHKSGDELAKSNAFDALGKAKSINYGNDKYQTDTSLMIEDENEPSGIRALLEKRIVDSYMKPDDITVAAVTMTHEAVSTMEKALESVPTTDDMGNEMTLTDAVDQFYQSAFNDDSYEFMMAFQKVRKLRNQTFNCDDGDQLRAECGVKITAGQYSSFQNVNIFPNKRGANPLFGPQLGQPQAFMPSENLTTTELQNRTTLVLRECITQLFKLQTKCSTMVTLSQHPKIMGLKKGVVTKLTSFFDLHGDKFMRYTNPNGATKSECIELIMTDMDVAKFMSDTQELHDEYLGRFPEVMTAEPVIALQPSKKKRKKANREARELAAKARAAGFEIKDNPS